MLRTVIYIRKSSEDETEKQAGSFDRQWRDIADFIEKQNSIRPDSERFSFDPDRDIIYEDRSAKEIGRPKFNDMIDRIKKWQYDVILCHELSRLSRNPIDNGVLAFILDQEQILNIQTLSNKFTNTPTDKFSLSLFLTVAKFENDQRGVNTSSGMQSKKSKGGTTNLANMGYINAGEGKGKRWIEKDGENFKILRTCWERLLTGNYKVSELYEYALDSGFTRVKSQKNGILRERPSQSAFRKVFSNPYYKGIIVITEDGIEKDVPGLHDAMVTSEEFDKAQIVLQKFGFSCSKKTNIDYDNILESILVCGKTGERFTTDTKTRYYCPTENCKNRYYSENGPKECPKCRKIYPKSKYKIDNYLYYRLREASHLIPGEKKPKKNISYSYIETEVDSILSKIVITDKLFSVLKRRMYTFWLEEQSKTNKRISKIKKEIDALENKNSTITKNGYSDENATERSLMMIKEAITDNEQLIREKYGEITRLKDENEEGFEIVWQALNTLLEAKKLFGKGALENCEPKRDLVISLFANLKFLDGKIIPEWQEPFMLLDKLNILTKQKSQIESEISELSCLWLPELDSNQGPTG